MWTVVIFRVTFPYSKPTTESQVYNCSVAFAKLNASIGLSCGKWNRNLCVAQSFHIWGLLLLLPQKSTTFKSPCVPPWHRASEEKKRWSISFHFQLKTSARKIRFFSIQWWWCRSVASTPPSHRIGAKKHALSRWQINERYAVVLLRFSTEYRAMLLSPVTARELLELPALDILKNIASNNG